MTQRDRLPVELRETVPRQGDVLREVFAVDLLMEIRRELPNRLFPEVVRLELDFRLPTGFVECGLQSHQGHGATALPANRFGQRRRGAREDRLARVQVCWIPEHDEVPSNDIRRRLRRRRV